MFRPPTLFFANRKADLLRRTLQAVGHPVDIGTARKTVAVAWGWMSWVELTEALNRPGAASALDEELVGIAAGAMVDMNEIVVARRAGRATRALILEIGLPTLICVKLGAFLSLTGRHQVGQWLSREAFGQLYSECLAPKPPFVLELLDGLGIPGRHASPFPLPPHRPR